VSRAARFWWSSTSSVAALLLLAGCGGDSGSKDTIEGPYGQGATEVWVTHAQGRPKAVVAILHGLSPTPARLDFKRWQRHLAHEGYDVIYPRYEALRGDPDAREGVVAGVRNGLGELGNPRVPLVLVGHSRGARLAVEAAAYLKPRAVVAVYPGRINPAFEEPTNLALIPSSTAIWLLVGDRDTGVGSAGAIEMFTRLRLADFPLAQIHGGVIHSTPRFTADHMSVYRTDPAAQKAVWQRVDGLIARALRG